MLLIFPNPIPRQFLIFRLSLTFLTPVFALLFGNLILAEVLSPLQSVGVCLTLVSIYLINQREQILNFLKLQIDQ